MSLFYSWRLTMKKAGRGLFLFPAEERGKEREGKRRCFKKVSPFLSLSPSKNGEKRGDEGGRKKSRWWEEKVWDSARIKLEEREKEGRKTLLPVREGRRRRSEG